MAVLARCVVVLIEWTAGQLPAGCDPAGGLPAGDPAAGETG